jgi:hypothetical protein
VIGLWVGRVDEKTCFLFFLRYLLKSVVPIFSLCIFKSGSVVRQAGTRNSSSHSVLCVQSACGGGGGVQIELVKSFALVGLGRVPVSNTSEGTSYIPDGNRNTSLLAYSLQFPHDRQQKEHLSDSQLVKYRSVRCCLRAANAYCN